MYTAELPFELGETLQGTDANGNLINGQWLGQKFEIPCKATNVSGVGDQKQRRSGRSIIAMPVRNVSGIKLYGKRLCLLDFATAGVTGFVTTKGYTHQTALSNCAIIDEFLETSGVADKDIFWAVLEGPVLVKTASGALVDNNIALGAKIVAGSGGGSSQGATAGGVGTTSAPAVQSIIGTALSARTTGETMVDLLISAAIRFI